MAVKNESFDGLSWSIDFDAEKKILKSTSTGTITVKSISEFSKSTFSFANKNNIDLILLDHSKSKVDESFMDMYNRPKVAEKLGIKKGHAVAFIMDSEMDYLTNFFETIFINRGFNYKSFKTSWEAEDWLLKQDY